MFRFFLVFTLAVLVSFASVSAQKPLGAKVEMLKEAVRLSDEAAKKLAEETYGTSDPAEVIRLQRERFSFTVGVVPPAPGFVVVDHPGGEQVNFVFSRLTAEWSNFFIIAQTTSGPALAAWYLPAWRGSLNITWQPDGRLVCLIAILRSGGSVVDVIEVNAANGELAIEGDWPGSRSKDGETRWLSMSRPSDDKGFLPVDLFFNGEIPLTPIPDDMYWPVRGPLVGPQAKPGDFRVLNPGVGLATACTRVPVKSGARQCATRFLQTPLTP